MNISSLSKDMRSWRISYNPYTDIFQMYSGKAFGITNDKTSSARKGDAVILFDKETDSPLLVEFRNAYGYIGDVDNMSKQAIISKVVEYVGSHDSKS